MNDLRDQTGATTARAAGVSTAALFMQHVYTWMTVALGVTAAAAYFGSQSPALMSLMFGSGIGMIVFIIAIFGLVMYLNARIHTLSAGAATGLFLLYSALMGAWLSPVVLVYTGADLTQAFVVTAGAFAGMSIFGWVTKKDLSAMGSFMVMGLIGIIIASLINLFLRSDAMSFVISVIGVIVFSGLTAWDTQKLKAMGENAPMNDATAIRRGAILGALTLYLDFVNMFLFMLRLLSNRN